MWLARTGLAEPIGVRPGSDPGQAPSDGADASAPAEGGPGDGRRRRPRHPRRGRAGADRPACGAKRRARRGVDPDRTAVGARHGRLQARLRRAGRPTPIPHPPAVDDEDLPPRTAVGDVRRGAGADPAAGRHPPAAAVQGRLDARARRAHRVPGGRRRRCRVHRERARDDSGARHAGRERDLAPRHLPRRDGLVSGRLRRRPRRPRHGRHGAGATAVGRTPALALRCRLADRVVARRPARRGRRVRDVGRLGHSARPPDAPGAVALPRRMQDHLLGGGRGRDGLRRRLLRAADRALDRYRGAPLGRLGERTRLRHPGRGRRACLRAELDGWIADRLLHPRRTSLGQVDRLVRLLLAGRGRRPRLLRLLQRRLLRALGPVGVDALGTRHRRADLRCGRRRRRDRVRRLVRPPDPGCRCATGKVVLDFPHGEYVPVAGGGRTLLLHGYSRLFAVERR